MAERDELQPALVRVLRAVAEDDDSLVTPSHVEHRLRAEVRSIARAHRRRLYLSSVAAVTALTVALSLLLRRARPEQPPAQTATRAEAATREVTTAFFPLVYSNVPSMTGHLVRFEVPGSALMAFGLGPADAIRGGANAPAMVYADVLVGEDGLARSVRFVLPFDGAQGRP